MGAIVGADYGNTTISNSSSSGSVAGSGQIGGVIGQSNGSNCTDCNSSCTVNGIFNVGGFTGVINNSNFTNCSSTGTVTGTDYGIGGFVGTAEDGSVINNCFSTSNVSGVSEVGGFAGKANAMMDNITIKNCYAKGRVTGTHQVGGFAGVVMFFSGEITNCYSSSVVSGTTNMSGFVGNYYVGTLSNCYFDAEVDGLAGTSTGTDNNGATGKTTAEMKTQATFVGWDFPTTWTLNSTDNGGYPALAWQGFSHGNPMKLKFTTTADGNYIKLPLYGTVDCTVDWGDGSATETFNTTGQKRHIFATAGTYTVSISGTLTQFGYYDTDYEDGWSGSDYLTEVVDFGSVGLTSLSGAFTQADNLSSVPATLPATVTDLSYCFYLNDKASITNLNSWDVSHVTNMSAAFLDASAFNQNISTWDVSAVTNMEFMFKRASAFNQPIGTWNVSSVTNMADMFRSADVFNQPIGTWVVSSVTTMEGMFENVDAFNQDISGWNVGSVTSMVSMFDNATSFNQDINKWDVSHVTDMSWMFSGAAAFNQSLADWKISSVTTMEDMFADVTLSTANYDALLIGWAAQTVKPNVVFSGGNSKYTAGAAATARGTLAGGTNLWVITDGGQQVFSGGAGTLASPYQISTLADLRYLSENSAYWSTDTYFIQTADIDATASNTWNVGNHDNNAVTPTVAMGFSPIGIFLKNFYGNYDGQNHSITGLYINRPATSYVGLFGKTDINSNLSNIKLINCNITGNSYVGALAGIGSGTITNCKSTGSVSGSSNIGGLIGYSDNNLTNCYSSCTVTGSDESMGGLIGSISSGIVTNSFSTGSVKWLGSGSGWGMGGFAGMIDNATVSNCYSNSNVSGFEGVGGFSGHIIGNSFAVSVTNCYATGTVNGTGAMAVGGFVGYADFTNGNISNCYSRSVVTGIVSVINGFVGTNFATYTNCYFDAETDGIAATTSGTDNNGATGKSTAQMITQATFSGWDFVTTPVWKIESNKNYGYPYLANQSSVAVTDNDNASGTLTNSDVTVSGVNTVLTVDAPKTFNSVTVEPGAKLDLTNALTITGDLIFKADETGSFNAKVGTAVTLATDSKVKYVKTMLDTKWYFLSFPCTVNIAEITQVGGGAFVLGQDWYIKYYNGLTRATNRGGANWVAITDQITGTLTANQGYIIGLKTGVGTQQLSFVLDNAIVKAAETLDRPIGVSVWDAAAGTHAGWNLVGQPFLSRFAGNKITGAPQGVTIPDAINGMTYTQPTMSSATFEPFSAYFVQVLADGNMSFDIAGRSSAPAAVATDLSDRVQLNFTSATGVDYTNLIMDNDQTTGYQIGQDLEKWIGTDTDKPQIYTQLGGINYGFNALPMTDVQNLPVGIYTKTAGTTTISASASQAPSLSKLILFDSSNGTTTDLLISSYSFIADAGTNNTRFSITAQRISTENVVETETGCPTLAINNCKLIINNLNGITAVRVYDAIGRMMASKTTGNNSMEIPLSVKGIYTVQMESGAKSWVRKVVIND